MDAPGADSQSNGFANPAATRRQWQAGGKSSRIGDAYDRPRRFRKQTQSCVLLRISNVWRVNASTSGSAAGGQRDQLNNGNS